MFYIVYAAIRSHPNEPLNWSPAPAGVFEADTAEEACQAAAKKVGWMGTYFATEGYPWGVEMIESEAKELGAPPSTDNEKTQNRIRELEKSVGIE